MNDWLRSLRAISLCAVAVICLAILGCGGGGSSPVSGQIMLGGQPLAGAAVSYVKADAPPGRAEGLFVGVTDAEGRYTLRRGIDKEPADIPPGKYRVSVTTTYVEGGHVDGTPEPIERVPAKYRNGWEFDVPEGGTDDATFNLESR